MMNVEVPVTIHIHQRSQPVVADALVGDWQLATDEVVAELEVRGEQGVFARNGDGDQPQD